MTTVFAWTAPGSNYPEYVNLTRKDDSIVVTVRAHANRMGQCGETISVEVPLDAWKEFDAAKLTPTAAPAEGER